MWAFLSTWRCDPPPVWGTPPTYWQLRRLCRWQARQFRRLARTAEGAGAHRAQEQVAWIASVLRHHPLLDDLQRTIQQSADLLRELAPDKFVADQHEITQP
ncbi:MAG: hypothetical protein EPN23_06505 [Verrucomicrobia bacterium]|nr:MAG: hypothetical protein EPN23_06505 [Verrucomicrobiota bacterium]